MTRATSKAEAKRRRGRPRRPAAERTPSGAVSRAKVELVGPTLEVEA